jgi:serine/threonine protein kinase
VSDDARSPLRRFRGVIPSALSRRPYNPQALALTLGTRLGVYEIIAQIGEGGMGQVFRARDTKLDRDVAIKILPASELFPVWTPDGGRLLFASSRTGGGIYWQRANMTGAVEQLTTAPSVQVPHSFSPDGSQLVLTQVSSKTKGPSPAADGGH